ncbi:LysM peptidoglycan-binding domain-containing protein [Desulfonema magnum]|uniref:LysM domain-containing protein n=1 Tax=Desulfonema magnum TaxID=45655 RepID=A0A975GPK1_9BACT|nr:hypothetical protein [Desulfonema magnum]QTA89096.1 LysM domain-containing protein [Desulfonema magnum]
MFEHDSRYYNLETATLKTADGGIVSYKRRRFLPRAEALQTMAEETVTEGDRLDLIAARFLGDPMRFWQICDANNAMNPFELTSEIGRKIRIGSPKIGLDITGNQADLTR